MKWRSPALFINAGSREGEGLDSRIETALEDLGLPGVQSEHAEEAALCRRIRERIRDGADLIIVGGGDGTLRLAAEEMAGGAVPLGILPLGTGNNLARDLSIPLEWEDACRVFREGKVRSIDIGEAAFAGGERRLFVNAVHIGLFGMTNARVDLKQKRRLGYLAYLLGARSALQEFTPFRLTMTQGRRSRSWNVTQASAVLGMIYAGGVGRIPGESLQDSRLTLSLQESAPLLFGLLDLLRILRSPGDAPARVHRFRTKTVDLEADPPQEINLDGEIVGRTPVCLRVLPRQLRVVTPAAPKQKSIFPGARKGWLCAGLALGALAAVAVAVRLRRGSSGK